MKKILIIRLSSVGDIVMALPVAAQLKEFYGDNVEITWIVKKVYSDIVEKNEFIDKVIYFEEFKSKYFRIIKEILRNLNKYLKKEKYTKLPLIENWLKVFPTSKRAKMEKYDIILDLQGSVESSIIGVSARANVKLTPGFVNNGIERFYKKIGNASNAMHRTDEYLNILDYLKIKSSKNYRYGWKFSDEEKSIYKKYYLNSKNYVIIALTTQWQSKNYPIKNWAKVIEFLNNNEIVPIIIGTNSDRPIIDELNKLISINNKFIDLSGKTSIRELILLIKNAALVIAGDSGPMHIASSLNIPLIALFGPTNPKKWGPLSKNSTILEIEADCKYCYKTTCPKNINCLSIIKPQIVINQIKNILKEK